MLDDSSPDPTNSNKVRLELYAFQLRNVAGAFKGTSDPFAVVTLLSSDPIERPRVLGKTEVIKNNLNPRWIKSFDINYEIGTLTRINVGIYDEVRKSNDIPMGSAMFEIGQVLAVRGNTKGKKLRNGGTVFARVTPAPLEDFGTLTMALCGVELKNVEFGGFFRNPNPFFELSTKVTTTTSTNNNTRTNNELLTWQPVYRSEHIKNELNPEWDAFTVDLGRLCEDGNLDKPVQIQVWDWEKSGKHTPMGIFETSVNELVGTASSSREFECKAARGKVCGTIQVTMAKMEGVGTSISCGPPATPADEAMNATTVAAAVSNLSLAPPTEADAAAETPAYTLPPLPVPLPPPIVVPPPLPPTKPRFVDYLAGDCELNMCIAIDFTGSNGDPRRPGTLHHIYPDGQQFNDYEKAITAVGTIIGSYDSHQQFPVWGFGAKYGGVIQHCFQVGRTEELLGIQGVLEGYRSVFHTGLTMAGPTVLQEVILMAAAKASSRQESAQLNGKQAYTVLLVLTDGSVSNVNQTKAALCAVSDAPLSIVIVGIGNADFGAMKFLDKFQELDNNSRTGGRDICKFVEFNKYKHSKTALTRETLSEIPCQLVDYFYNKGMMPLPPTSESKVSPQVDEADDNDIDLSLNMNSNGEISLATDTGAIYDDAKYYHAMSQLQPLAPPVESQSQSAYSSSSSPLPPATSELPYFSAPNSNATPNYRPETPPRQQRPTGTSESRLFHVKVPPGVSSGMQVRVQNPYTHQDMYVVIPHGVPPGGTFAARY